jgi:hypothetical protein
VDGVRGVRHPGVNADKIVAISGTTSVLATPFVVMDGTESFRDSTGCERAVPNCIPTKSASAAIKAAVVSVGRMLKVDMR